MQSMTHREYLTWLAWLEDQWNVPDRTDYYLMQIAGHVAHVMSRKSWQPGEYQIKFESRKQTEETPKKIQQPVAESKHRWRMRAERGGNAWPKQK
jgi:hypothetical protein